VWSIAAATWIRRDRGRACQRDPHELLVTIGLRRARHGRASAGTSDVPVKIRQVAVLDVVQVDGQRVERGIRPTGDGDRSYLIVTLCAALRLRRDP
jgi:hypothetical protein